MLSMAIPNQVYEGVSIERKPWNSEAWNDVLGFLVKSFGVVCAATFLYSLGLALGMTLIAVSFVVWSLLRNQIACEQEEGSEEHRGYAAALNSASRGHDPVWIRSDRFGMSTAAATRPVQRQGA
jgi:hypothetical protein